MELTDLPVEAAGPGGVRRERPGARVILTGAPQLLTPLAVGRLRPSAAIPQAVGAPVHQPANHLSTRTDGFGPAHDLAVSAVHDP
jgi:hypothetical protein